MENRSSLFSRWEHGRYKLMVVVEMVGGLGVKEESMPGGQTADSSFGQITDVLHEEEKKGFVPFLFLPAPFNCIILRKKKRFLFF